MHSTPFYLMVHLEQFPYRTLTLDNENITKIPSNKDWIVIKKFRLLLC